jgi:hypothetical protein
MISDATREMVRRIAEQNIRDREQRPTMGLSAAFYDEMEAQTMKLLQKTRRPDVTRA